MLIAIVYLDIISRGKTWGRKELGWVLYMTHWLEDYTSWTLPNYSHLP
jgi:hypothetical protein